MVDVLVWLDDMIREEYATSSLWTMWSGVKAFLRALHYIDFDEWKGAVSRKLNNVKKRRGEKTKKAHVFTNDDLVRICGLHEEQWLQHKLALCFGIYGGLRAQDYGVILQSDITLKMVCLCVFCSFCSFFCVL